MTRHRSVAPSGVASLFSLCAVLSNCVSADEDAREGAPIAALQQGLLHEHALPSPLLAFKSHHPLRSARKRHGVICPKGIPERYREIAQTFDAELAELGIPGASFALIEDGRLSFAHGAGVKGPDSLQRVNEDTLFRIGSMTKALTATGLLAAAEEHDVALDTPVQKILPEVQLAQPEYAALTLHHLLSHQSGLFDYTVEQGTQGDRGLAEFLTSPEFAANTYFMAPPGTFYNYSNPNFALAAFALERIDGRYYRSALQRRVLQPLGMQRTYFLASEVLRDGNYSAGSVPDPNGELQNVAPDAYDNAGEWGAGFAFSSVVQYAHFVEFLLNGNTDVLSEERRHQMQSMQVSTGELGEYAGYGYGLLIGTLPSIDGHLYDFEVVQHNGAIPGYQSLFAMAPESGFGIVIFANRAGVPLFPNTLRAALVQLIDLPAEVPAPAEAQPDLSRYPLYAGTYDDPHIGGTIEVTADNGVLRIASTGVDAAGVAYDKVLQPATRDNFVLTVDGEQLLVTFLPDESGKYVWLRTRALVARRR